MSKKILGLILTVMMILALFPALPVKADDPLLRVGDTYIDTAVSASYMDGKVEYDASTHTLTLNDLDLTYNGPVIYADGLDFDLTIKGSAKLTSEYQNVISPHANLILDGDFEFYSAYQTTVFLSEWSLTIDGGSLYAKQEGGNVGALDAKELILNNYETFVLGDIKANEIKIAQVFPAMFEGTDVLSFGCNTSRDATPIVQYGGKNWYVIAYEGQYTPEGPETAVDLYPSDAATLLVVGNQGVTKYDPENYINAYGTSTLKKKIDGEGGIQSGFTAGELEAVQSRTLTGGGKGYDADYDDNMDEGYDSNKISGADVTAELWPLSVAEANKVNNDLRIADPEHTNWLTSFWWLRSPGIDDLNASDVRGDGLIEDLWSNVDYDEYGVRPAFYLNLESVLFTSAVEGGKSCTEGALTQIGTNSTKEWKVTVKDKAHADFAVNTCAVTYDSSTGVVTVPYSGVSKTGDNEYISAIVKNSKGEITYYGRIAKASTAENASVMINTSGKVGDGDKLYVFYEQFNGDQTTTTEGDETKIIPAKTDYASDLQEVPLANGSHDWEFKGFEWTGDETNGYTKAVAKFECQNNTGHTNDIEITPTEEVVKPKCEEGGKTTYTATLAKADSPDGAEHSDSKDAKATKATDHKWVFMNFTWEGNETDGYTKAVANYVCENDSTHTDEVEATITEAVTDPTTTTTGKTTYSATVPSDKSLDGQPHDATNTENAEKEAKVTDMIVYTFTEGDGSTWTKGSSENLDATVKRSVDDDTTFARCQKITVDGKTELTDADCTKAEGSLKLSLKPGFLETLSGGKHTLVVTFDDGDSPEMTFTIEAKAEEETKPDTSPTTGDHNNAGLWAAIMGGSLLAVILLITAGRKYLKKHR